ncbi:uncharacterized protein MONBRDRAFT_28820 [Monosiga brevicollis MX1]|uniref:Golvesin/Xly CBD-like domain-containing protein n=1 Tax=Monosiga brevicollis TaxID=81824 RepID=A9V9I8_MONBE|nr:uncharacterized protein MONBRDRAFT_28820 [Monosiga brevicollis MX1]EDQ85803.1 predicted protein [Monosiga brevicollis MX1]|eukprot:XP_001749282.1 hypothetical protein [Monosiga brevicollis MX1]
MLLMMMMGMGVRARAVGAAPGIDVWPNSTVLPAGTAAIAITVRAEETDARCRWALTVPPPAFAEMNNFTAYDHGNATLQLSLRQDGNTTLLAIRCQPPDADEDADWIARVYRPVPSINNNFPKVANLWGSGHFQHNLSHAASHVSLWLGADFTPDQMLQLRRYNDQTLLLTSTNAVEGHDGLPERYYLHNVSGQSKKDRLSTWPGSYRLDLTKPEVALYKAQHMYSLVFGGSNASAPALPYDGIFVDNVYMTQSWQKTDVNGNPFYPDPDGTGQPMFAAEFDRLWRAGVTLELTTFRQLMPGAVMSGHSTDPHDPTLRAIFNARNIGFTLPSIIEGLDDFDGALQAYADWFDVPHQPHITVMESAIQLQIGYGYGFDSQILAGSIPASTLSFARHYYSYMRFGLAFVLMYDGYFTHEIGDSSHGQDWWYDEMGFALGEPLAPVLPALPAPANQPIQAFPMNKSAWSFWSSTPGNISLQWDCAGPNAQCNASATVTQVLPSNSKADFYSNTFNITAGLRYNISFAARTTSPNCSLELNARQNGGHWSAYGLDSPVWIDATWSTFNRIFTATATDPRARLSFYLGQCAGTTTIGSVVAYPASAPVLRRDFENGVVLLNGDNSAHNISVGSGFAHIEGEQAPRWQYIVDDASPSFSADNTTWSQASIEGGYSLAHPTDEVNSGPYFHQWASSCRLSQTPGATSSWDLGILDKDVYNVSTWWPALPKADSEWSANASFEVRDRDGTVVSQATLDQRSNGDTWHAIATNLSLAPGTTVHLTCRDDQGRACVADAILVQSASRYNNGQPTDTVRLAAMDGIILRRI